MIVAIVGPTGIGKTRLSIALAKHFDTELISGDSVQVYQGLDIGSAKVTKEEADGIKHHLIDIIEPTEEMSVALFQRMVREKISAFEQQGLLPIIVGGTGLYIKAVLYDYNFTNTKRDPAFQAQYDTYSNEELYDLLGTMDTKAQITLHPNNRNRILQAIQRSRDNKVSDNTNKDIPVYDALVIGLKLDREQLYPMLNKRVDTMIDSGLIEEVQGLYDQGIQSNAISAIGYKELYRYFDGAWSLEEAIDKIKQHHRNLAKKQYTFFENQFPIHWIDVDLDNFDNTIDTTIQLIESEYPDAKTLKRSI